MKAQLLLISSIVLIATSTTALADKDHRHDGDRTPMSGMMHSNGDMPMENMKDMHQHMTKMQKTMKKIHDTEDMKKKQKLMHQHMQEMHKGMGMMQGMMSGSKSGPMKGKMRMPMEKMDDDGDMSENMGYKQRHQMMEQRMDMIQGMMEQMMGHMMQNQKMGM